MKKALAGYLLLSVFLISCSKVPITGRKQVNMLPESSLMSMSLTNYQSFLNENSVVSGSDNRAAMVKKVGDRIARATEAYLKQKGNSKRIEGYKWEFNLVNDNTANAWCMPGGKVVVYTGILQHTQDEDGLAVVMGHEIAHAIARHGNERMSQGLMVELGGIGLAVATSDQPEQTRNLFMSAYGVGATVGAILPFSRLHESEADEMGLAFMAMAGYNPEKAVDFWTRMSKSGGASVPEFLSTHPSHDTRIQKIKAYLPEAKAYGNKYKIP